MTAFERFDALLGFWLDGEGRLTIPYDKLRYEMKEHDCDVGFELRRWKRVLRRTKPPLENIATILSDQLFIDEFFPQVTTKYMRRMAFETDNAEMLKLFLGDRVKNMFQNACRFGKTEIVKMLLEDGRADPTFRDNLTIILESARGHTEIVKLLLEDGRADPTADDNLAIRWASKYGHTEVVKLLLEDGRADPTAQDNYATSWAYWYGHVEVVRLLLDDPMWSY